MEPRLLPVNALIALCAADRSYPNLLHREGYHLAGIEIPVETDGGKVVADAVMFHPLRNVVLVGEAKSGANVRTEQARRYAQLDAQSVVRAASITVQRPGEIRVQPVFCALSENAQRVLLGLDSVGLSFPVISFDDQRIQHVGAEFVDGSVEAMFRTPVEVPGWPPLIISVDDQSEDSSFDHIVAPVLVSELSQGRRTEMTIRMLAEQAVEHFALYGARAQGRLVKKVDRSARRLADVSPSFLEYGSRTQVRRHAVVRFLKSPEDVPPRVRTQVYQSLQRPFRDIPDDGGYQIPLFDEIMGEFLPFADQAEGMTDE